MNAGAIKTHCKPIWHHRIWPNFKSHGHIRTAKTRYQNVCDRRWAGALSPPANVIIVSGSFRFPEESAAKARVAMLRVIAKTQAENGCLEYSYSQDLNDPAHFRVFEAWENRECLAAHFETAHMRDWQEQRGALGFLHAILQSMK